MEIRNINELIKSKDIEDIYFDFKSKDLTEGKGLSLRFLYIIFERYYIS